MVRKMLLVLAIAVASVGLVSCSQPTEEPTVEVSTPEASAPEESRPAVSGNVTYRERVALPDGAKVDVQLVELSGQGISVVSRQSIESPGQVPIPYVLAYDPGKIVDSNLYTVHAAISDAAGTQYFVSTDLYPVITFDHPTSGVEVVVHPVVSDATEPAAGSPPVVSMTLKSLTVPAGEDVDVYTHATATDGTAITLLELYVDDEVAQTWDSPDGEPWIHHTFVLRSVEEGEYSLRIRAVDTNGDEGWTQVETLTVEPLEAQPRDDG